MRYPVSILCLVAAAALARPAAGETAAERQARLLDTLVAAYPDHLAGHDGTHLVRRDGTRMAFDDGTGAKNFETMLEAPDIEDQFYAPYPRGRTGVPPGHNQDPGRVRNEAFLAGMYGDCRKREVERHLVDVVWLPRNWGKSVKVTRINNVAQKLEAVSRQLDGLPARFIDFLKPSAGTYSCRPIAGTTRISPHGYGTAIDINVARADYWMWSKPDAAGRYAWRNRVPWEIVEIFEAHGFIWGGKWYHYDTMHFEYRPELLAGR